MSQFRITLEPEARLSVPTVWRFPVEVDSDYLHYPLDTGESEPEWEVAQELVLRGLFSLDVDDPVELAEFQRRNGALHSLDSRERIVRSLAIELLGIEDQFGPELDEDLDHLRVPVHVARAHVLILRAIVDSIEAVQADDDDALVAAWADRGLTGGDPLKVEDSADLFLNASLNRALQPLSPRVVIARYKYASRAEALADASAPQHYLFSALAAQAFNLLVEGTPIRRCANETCGQRFAKQFGRAEYGQHRTVGVQYCSRNCARAQAQREYRRRQKREGTQ